MIVITLFLGKVTSISLRLWVLIPSNTISEPKEARSLSADFFVGIIEVGIKNYGLRITNYFASLMSCIMAFCVVFQVLSLVISKKISDSFLFAASKQLRCLLRRRSLKSTDFVRHFLER